jgi:uncharacterized protein
MKMNSKYFLWKLTASFHSVSSNHVFLAFQLPIVLDRRINMKASRYNLILTTEDGQKIAFNSTSCALAEVDADFFEILDNIAKINLKETDERKKRLIELMMQGNYIVDDAVDELKILKYRHLSGKYNNFTLGLTVALTLGCNFDCPYCYERSKQGFISQEAVEGIVAVVTEAAKKRKDIQITWYGGEPLLAQDIMFDLSDRLIKICMENEANYSAFIVTNGYLLTEETIGKLKEAKVTGAQVTIDGPPAIHNSRRRLKGSLAGTFDTILDHVVKIKEHHLNVTIRVNIDKSNIDAIPELLEILEINQLKDVLLTLGHVTAYTEACMSVAESCLSAEEYAQNDLKFQRLFHERGFNIDGYPFYPGIKGNYCCADAQYSFVLDPDGYMYKCWNDVGDVHKAVGDIKRRQEGPDQKMLMQTIDYLFWSPFDFEQCRECNLLPICMGGCPYNGLKNGDRPECEKWKYNLDKILKLTYERNKRPNPEKVASEERECG